MSRNISNQPRTLPLTAFVLLLALGPAGCAPSERSSDFPETEVLQDQTIGFDSVRVLAGSEYQAGWFHRLFFGSHYRDLWASSIAVEQLDLNTFAGGLTPTEAGGGFQTKSLKFSSNNGGMYKFRSTNKDPSAVLPYELQGTFADDIAQDHISTSHPAGAVVVDSLAGAVGVPNLQARLVFLPDDETLGEFREVFGGLLGVFEIYPDDRYRDFEKVQNTMKMFRGMENNSEDRPDPAAFLTARFLDIYVNDWDRHVKQWKWGRITRDGRKVWLPIPLDRDQAFARLDGFVTWTAKMSITQFEHFDDRFHSIYKISFSGRYLDRRLLVGVDRQTWDSLATSFVDHLTDEVIQGAVRRLPAEYYALDGARLEHALKSRRDSFAEAASRYYRQLADYVDIYLSDKREDVEVTRLDDQRVEVTAWRQKKSIGGSEGTPVYHRIFERNETKEIRLYTLGKDDRVLVRGSVESSIPVRVVGGKGDDELIDESLVKCWFLGIIPFIPDAETMTYFYDHRGKNTIVAGRSTSVDTDPYTPVPGGLTQY
ncbi:MAG: hypothetical protein WBG80_13340 [Bacteroidota bacterium]